MDALRAKRKTLDPASEEAKKLSVEIQRSQADLTTLSQQANPRPEFGGIHPLTRSEMRTAIKTVCEREGIDLVLPIHDGRDRLLYFNEHIDITAAVIKELQALNPE
ncbi:Outer membrane protein (OmpH-like) [Anatilimnocola aggregata]|uniref:Outer membrane protein (OmpH-like) n=1 Tax=Anatilimnocola aggregata TaxID=2528021 RepID=A0A517YCT3_9BACT|nr:OmpH family outer membrane protein [Anatilimnocola aggregata]QDU28040.1 Outer membrane protein (OmpH-like) [Anatilimnocola aggregata]